MTCGMCDKTDGLCYTSNPPMVKCTVTGEFHYYDDPCSLQENEKAMIQKDQKEKLIELLSSVTVSVQYEDGKTVSVKQGNTGELADYLISNGVTVTQRNPYWDNICRMANKQRAKGIKTYGSGLENNTSDIITRIEYLQEELIDGLMYCEWIKDQLRKQKE